MPGTLKVRAGGDPEGWVAARIGRLLALVARRQLILCTVALCNPVAPYCGGPDGLCGRLVLVCHSSLNLCSPLIMRGTNWAAPTGLALQDSSRPRAKG